MGWISSVVTKAVRYGMLLFVTAGLAVTAMSARADVGTGDNLYRTISNNFLTLYVGTGKNVAGVFELDTTSSNPTDPSGILLFGGIALTGTAIEAPKATPIQVGTRLFVRVDGGISGGGYDYIFGRHNNGGASDGQWIIAPRIVGSHIEASWQTLPQTVNSVIIDPRIEIDLVASFVHDQVRFQFSIKNNSPGQSHRVGLAFTEDVDTTFITTGQPNFTLGGPLRFPNAPYLHHEAILSGGQVPPFWDVFVLGPAAPGKSVPRIRSVRGILAPLNSGQTEPTRPTRFAYGDLYKLNGAEPNPPATVMGRDFDEIWNFVPDPKIILEGAGGNDAAVTCYWDEQAVGAGQSIPIVTYIGQSTSDTDFSPPVSLSVSAPLALGFTTVRDANGNATGVASTPSPFTIDAFVQNLTDLLPSGGLTVSPVTVFLDLPKGLVLNPADQQNPKTILNVAPGQESAVSWQVSQDTRPGKQVNGTLHYTVTASPNIGNGKSVQRTIEIPAPASITSNLKGDDTTQGLYTMLSFPLIFGNATPSSILHLNGDQPSPQFDLVRYNPTTGHYEPVNTFIPGLSYWFRMRLSQARLDQLIQDKQTNDPGNVPGTIDATKFPPLDNQVQPSATGYKVNYPRGWNQIGDPFIYGIRFSEVQVFDQATLNIVDISTATDPLHQWIQPAVFFYDTSDANPQNWHYVLEDNLGFIMQPYQGYWILVKRDGLQLIYPGVDTPGAAVTRAAKVGVGLGSTGGRSAANNWRLTIRARGTVSTDNTTTIGVASKATDNADYYKVNKPPLQENQLALDIIHADWTDGGRYATDLRSPSQNRKTWNMTLTSSKPNETVTLSWPDVAANVPRSYRLTMIDTDTNQRYDLRHSSSVVVTTNATKTRNIQIVAEPTRGVGPALITNFDVVQSATRAAGAPSSVSINYALSQAADTRIYIRSGNGRAIRTLSGTTRAAADGGSSTGTAVWDMRDSKGAGIPSGVYNVELVAQGADGQVSRQVRPFLLTR